MDMILFHGKSLQMVGMFMVKFAYLTETAATTSSWTDFFNLHLKNVKSVSIN